MHRVQRGIIYSTTEESSWQSDSKEMIRQAKGRGVCGYSDERGQRHTHTRRRRGEFVDMKGGERRADQQEWQTASTHATPLPITLSSPQSNFGLSLCRAKKIRSLKGGEKRRETGQNAYDGLHLMRS